MQWVPQSGREAHGSEHSAILAVLSVLMDQKVTFAQGLSGTVLLPADKSVAHRSALFAAIADGTSRITNFPLAADPRSTLSCIRQLGIHVTENRPGEIVIEGQGREGLSTPEHPLDCRNSGTTMRLLSGIVAGAGLRASLIGDASLSVRPMQRIANPLRQMGASIALSDDHAPIHIRPQNPLSAITYPLPIPSAQVKSCVLLAGLFAQHTTEVIETVQSRDHTERMLGLKVKQQGAARHIYACASDPVPCQTLSLPRDFSAAAFFLVAGSVVSEGVLYLPSVGINPTRSALVDVLRGMGANISVGPMHQTGPEPIADLTVRPAELQGITLSGALIPSLIDELPVLAVAAACARGRTTVTGAAELRHKECDRIRATVTNLRTLGADVHELEDGFVVEGGMPLQGAPTDSLGDHRIAMAMGIAALVARGTTTVRHAEVADVSFPGFWDALRRIAIRA